MYLNSTLLRALNDHPVVIGLWLGPRENLVQIFLDMDVAAIRHDAGRVARNMKSAGYTWFTVR